jgi:hypothetical protein
LDSSAVRLRSSASRNAWTLLSERPADAARVVRARRDAPRVARELLERDFDARELDPRELDDRELLDRELDARELEPPLRLLELVERLRPPPLRPDLEPPELVAIVSPLRQ